MRWLANSGRGVDFDDSEYGFKEEDKDPQKVLISHIYHFMMLIATRLKMRPTYVTSPKDVTGSTEH